MIRTIAARRVQTRKNGERRTKARSASVVSAP
jgi:hypothetical protein